MSIFMVARSQSLPEMTKRTGTGTAAGVLGLGIGEGEARGERGGGHANGPSAGRRWLILSGEGKRVPTKIRYSKIRMQVAPSCCQTYIMASFKQSQNYNGAGIVLRIVMAFFENPKIVMAQNKLTLL